MQAITDTTGAEERIRSDNQGEKLMQILWSLVIGLIVGAVAKLLMPGRDPGGVIITSLLGIAGSLIATFIGQALGWYQHGQAAGFIMSVLGAILLLSIYRMFRHRTA
jgi:uncharacterized membrane protein YeaQ/YmgE (transglycosylase-associated protein family)